MSEDVIRIMCPKLTCRRILAVPTEARGRTVRCRNCGTNIKIPAKPPAVAPVETEQDGQAPAQPPAQGKKGGAPEQEAA